MGVTEVACGGVVAVAKGMLMLIAIASLLLVHDLRWSHFHANVPAQIADRMANALCRAVAVGLVGTHASSHQRLHGVDECAVGAGAINDVKCVLQLHIEPAQIRARKVYASHPALELLLYVNSA